MKRRNKKIADVLLIVFAIVFLISYPFKDFFVLGLISSYSLAALIGGLADLFGITAIFKKPLGLNWPKTIFRTDIINNNREKFINTIVTTLQEDLLSIKKLKEKFKELNIAVVVVLFIKSKDGDEILNSATSQVSVFTEEKRAGILNLSKELEKNVVRAININESLYKVLLFIRAEGYEDKLIDKTIDVLVEKIKSEDIHKLIHKIYIEAMKNYEKENPGRVVVNKFLLGNIMGMSDEKAVKLIIEKISGILLEAHSKENKNRKFIEQKIKVEVERLKTDEKLIEKINLYVDEFITKNDKLANTVISYINRIYDLKKEKRQLLSDFIKDKEKMSKFNLVMKEAIFKLIDDKHDEIGKIALGNLNKYNNDKITDLIKNRVEDDLQIIRINGSLVGGIVGIIAYLLTFWIA